MAAAGYQQRLGERLRSIRTQQDLTLQQVEERSAGQWKAVVVGSYERGSRSISAAKLAELAGFYGVPVGEVLPRPAAAPRDEVEAERVVLDLVRLGERRAEPWLQPLARMATTVQVQRGDFNGRVLTLRGADVNALSVLTGVDREQLIEQLSGEGVLVGT